MSDEVAPMPEDHVQWFQAYLAFAGDLDRVQAVLQVSRARLEAVAREFKWVEKLRAELGGEPGAISPDQQRMLNRSVNLVQATKLRQIADAILTHFSTGGRHLELITITTKFGTGIDVRPLKDLASAIETAQNLTRQALGDTADKTIEESAGDQDPAKVSAAIQKALGLLDAAPGISSVQAVAEIVGAQGKHGQRKRKIRILPEPPKQ